MKDGAGVTAASKQTGKKGFWYEDYFITGWEKAGEEGWHNRGQRRIRKKLYIAEKDRCGSHRKEYERSEASQGEWGQARKGAAGCREGAGGIAGAEAGRGKDQGGRGRQGFRLCVQQGNCRSLQGAAQYRGWQEEDPASGESEEFRFLWGEYQAASAGDCKADSEGWGMLECWPGGGQA